MSADHLPDDLRHWPRDPYQVLGVARGCDPLAARKAYTALIRQFKPEQFPEQFRLIREAYDSIKREAAFYTGPTEVPSEAAEPAPLPSPEAETVDSLWAAACDNASADAYRRLRERYDSHPFGSELPARLYALLLAYPELDLRHQPCDWLARGCVGEQAWGPCRQLYRREIDDHPDEVLTERFGRLLDAAPTTASLLELLGWRWEALLRLGQVELLATDLAQLAPRLEQADEVAWVRVLLRAADFLAWHNTSRFEELCGQIDRHVHVHAALGDDLSRLDFLQELARNWQALRRERHPRLPLVPLVPYTWTSPFENRHRLLAACRPIADDPPASLAALDGLLGRTPLVVIQLGQALGSLWYTSSDPRDEADHQAAVKQHLDSLIPPVGEPDYFYYRPYLLRFCIAELIAPEVVAQVLINNQAVFAFQRILDDWPLRTVCLAHRLIWA